MLYAHSIFSTQFLVLMVKTRHLKRREKTAVGAVILNSISVLFSVTYVLNKADMWSKRISVFYVAAP